MKKWYLLAVAMLCSLVYADKHSDDFNLHANSWAPAFNQPGGATRKYVNSVDGMECFITETDSKKIITSYDCYGNKLHTFDLFYGSCQESEFLSLFPQAAGSSSGPSPHTLPTNYNTPRLSSPQQLQQFIQHQENARPGKRARSFQNSITDQQILSSRYLAGDATDEEVRAYYENLAAVQAYAEQQEQDRLQAIVDLKALQKRHTQEWNQLCAQQQAALTQAKKNHKDKNYMKRLKASQEQARNELLLQQYAENPTMAKYFYLGCKNMKDGVSSLFGTQYNPLPTPQSTIISPDQIEEDRALITYAQQQLDTYATLLDHVNNLLDQSIDLSHTSPRDQVELQNLHDEHVELLATTGDHAPQEFTDVMQDRVQALHVSLQNPTPHVVNYQLKDDTMKTLQAYNIDPAIFLSTDGVAIHQQLTQELVDILDNLGAIAVKNPTNIAMQESSLMCAQVAALAQQENKIHHLAQAVSATNCTHGLFHYLDGLTQHGFEKCESMMQSLAYFSTELAKYTGSVARGAAQGIIATEISSAALGAVGSLASSCAPVLTATISSAASAAIVPIALTAGCVCATVAVGELVQLGYFYATDQMVSFHEACAGITKFACQFYDFNQTSYQHVENVSQAVATVVWPWKGQAIVNALQGLQTVHCDLYVAGEKLAQKSFATTKDVVARAQSMVEHHQLDNFNGLYKKIMGEHYFDFFKKEQLKLAGVIDSVSMHDVSSFLPSNTHVLLQKSIEEKIITSGVSQLGQQYTQDITNAIIPTFLETSVGQNMQQLMTKEYEQKMLRNITKEYGQLIVYKTPKQFIDQFLHCHQTSIVPAMLRAELDAFQNELAKPEYEGVGMQLRHIFYPKLTPKFDPEYQQIISFALEGFHHDEYEALEKSGLFSFVNKIHGNEQFGAQECFIGISDWGSGIICDELKTFFPSSWPKEKVVHVILEANKNRIKEINIPQKNQKKFQCQGPNNMLIDIIINDKNMIISAYPSIDNFLGVLQ